MSGVEWRRVEIALPDGVATEPFEAAIEGDDIAIAITREAAGGWRLAFHMAAPVDRDGLDRRIADAAAAAGIDAPEITVEPVPDIDWVGHVQAMTPPVRAGRFFVYGSHVEEQVPEGCIGILMDAGRAFGTGSHESTRGCLIALDRIAEAVSFGKILDLGCGSGILSIAAARLWPAAITAADVEPEAVAMTERCARANGVAARVTALRSRGFQNARVRRRGPFGLVLANILARPLMRLAPAIARHTAPGGRVVLSGLIEEQGPAVIEAYGRQGFAPAERIMLDEWLTLVLGKPD